MSKIAGKIKYLLSYLFLAFVVVLIFYYVFKVWNWDISVPFDFSRDTITDGGTLTLAAKAIDREGIISTKCFWSIDNINKNWGIIDGSVHYFLMRMLALFIHSAGTLANVYFIITYVLCALVMYYCILRLNVNPYLAMSISVVYAFIPGHAFRGLGHLAIGACFALPLMALGCVYVLQGVYDKNGNVGNKRRMVESCVGVLMVGFSSIYFCFFAAVAHAICMLIMALNKKIKSAVCAIILLVLDIVSAICTVILPNLFSRGMAVQQIESTRQLSDIHTYGLDIGQLLLPVKGHRIGVFDSLVSKYSQSFGGNEGEWATLGILFSISLIITILCVFVDRRDEEIKTIRQIGKLSISLILVSAIGGLSGIIGLFVGAIRCYNRMSFLIACFCAISMAVGLNKFLSHRKRIYCVSVAIIIGLCGVFDQTTVSMAFEANSARQYKEKWENEELFFDTIAETGAKKVLIYPSKYSQLYKDDLNYKYEIIKPYIHTTAIKYSTGYNEGSKTDEWIQGLENYTSEQKLKICAAEDFDGVLLYSDGFKDEDQFQSICAEFVECVGRENQYISQDGKWVYFSIEKYLKNIKKWDQKMLSEACEDIAIGAIEFKREYMFGLSEMAPFLKEGFSYGESDFRWSEGERSSLEMQIDEKEFGDLQICFKYEYVYEPQNIKIYVNNYLQLDTFIDTAGSFGIEIPRENLDDAEGRIKIDIEYEKTSSPMEKGEGIDGRKLAVAWKSITILDTGKNSKENDQYISLDYLEKYLGR